MSLSRAFTTRRLKTSNAPADGPKTPQRAHTLRHKISAPVQLIHTTNMLSYNAPDLPRPARINTARRSEDDSDSMDTTESTPPTSPDVASNEASTSPGSNRLSGYFKNNMKPSFAPEFEPAPAIPQRAPSHTKKSSYDAIARSRSMRMSRDSEQSLSKIGQTFSRSASTSTRASTISTTRSLKQPISPAPLSPAASITQLQSTAEAHPFGPELAQVTELAEEYNTSSQLELVDEDAEYLQSRGLIKFSADDYLGAIQGLSLFFFPETSHAPAATPLWI